MKDQIRKALGEAITARFAGRINLKHGQKALAAEFGLTQPDISLCHRGQWERMSTDKMLDIASKVGVAVVGQVVFGVDDGSDADKKFVSVVEAKEAAITAAVAHVFDDSCPM